MLPRTEQELNPKHPRTSSVPLSLVPLGSGGSDGEDVVRNIPYNEKYPFLQGMGGKTHKGEGTLKHVRYHLLELGTAEANGYKSQKRILESCIKC